MPDPRDMPHEHPLVRTPHKAVLPADLRSRGHLVRDPAPQLQAIVVGPDPMGYSRRYCYEHATEAKAALAAWNGRDHPGGPWIKCKGAGLDLLNPALTC